MSTEVQATVVPETTPTESTPVVPAAPLTDADKAIKKQLEFYFSDANFRRDAFLRGQAETNTEGNVAIATLLTFKRLQSMTTDPNTILRVLADSKTVNISADKLSLCRSVPLPTKDDTKYRTMFAQLIPKDATLDELRTVFSQAKDCKVELVRMRREKSTKEFLGSAFVEYATQSQLRTALQFDFEVKGEKLNTCALEEFLYAAKERRAQETSNQGYGGDAKRQHTESASSSSSSDGPIEFTKGLLLKITKNDGVQLDRETIRAALEPHGKVAFIDYSRGDDTGTVRMGDAAAAMAVLKAMNGGAVAEVVAEVVADVAVVAEEVATVADDKKEEVVAAAGPMFTAVALEGDAEETYWKAIKSNQKALYKSRGGDRKRSRNR